MKYIRTALWVIAFLVVLYAQYNYVQSISYEAEQYDAKQRQDSLEQCHSELDWDSLHEAQMEADLRAVNEKRMRTNSHIN